MTFKLQLESSAPDDVEFVTFRRLEGKANYHIYTKPDMKKYTVPYDTNLEEFWQNRDKYLTGDAEDFFWGFSQRWAALDEVLMNSGNSELATKYTDGVCQICDHDNSLSSSFTVHPNKIPDITKWAESIIRSVLEPTNGT